MAYYTQRDEEPYILNYFQGKTGNFLDIGAFHPTDKSNVRALYEKGWSGALIEPSRSVLPALEQAYEQDIKSGRIELHKIAIGEVNKKKPFYDSGGDAVSSFSKEMVQRWSSRAGDQYDEPLEYEAPMHTIDSFMKLTKFKTFDFISIDTEGLGLEILKQIDFDKLGVQMVCIEFDDKLSEIREYLFAHNFYKLHQTAENLICVR